MKKLNNKVCGIQESFCVIEDDDNNEDAPNEGDGEDGGDENGEGGGNNGGRRRNRRRNRNPVDDNQNHIFSIVKKETGANQRRYWESVGRMTYNKLHQICTNIKLRLRGNVRNDDGIYQVDRTQLEGRDFVLMKALFSHCHPNILEKLAEGHVICQIFIDDALKFHTIEECPNGGAHLDFILVKHNGPIGTTSCHPCWSDLSVTNFATIKMKN